MKKIVLYSIILMLFLKTKLYGHGEWVHQSTAVENHFSTEDARKKWKTSNGET